MTSSDPPAKTWRREGATGEFLISTSKELLNYEFINEAFGSKDMYWAKTLPMEQLHMLLSNSQPLGLYKVLTPTAPPDAEEPSSPRTPSPTLEEPASERCEQIGLARFITDYVTTSYLTDVYVLPEYRGSGLGKWLVACCNEILNEVPAMRRAVLMATPGEGQSFYARELGFYDMHDEHEHAIMMTRRGFRFDREKV